MLLASLALNVAALVVPFMDMRKVFSTEEYSLPRSVQLLWESELYVLAVVVVAFSILFPFAKLGVLAAIVCGRVRPRRRLPWLEAVGRLGKWSMLDVFLVCLMITLASDQWMVGARPRLGILLFTLAILLSMISGSRIQKRLRAAPPEPPGRRNATSILALGHVLLLALLVAGIAVPFLEIDDWRLSDRPISVVGSVHSLWQSGAVVLALVMAAFLVAAPVASGLLSILALWRAHGGRTVGWILRALAGVRHYAMLDVFALALGIYLVEGRAFVTTELTWGAFLIVLFLVLHWPASSLVDRRLS